MNNELSGGMVNATLRVNGEKIISPFHTDMNKVNLLVGSNPTSTPIKNQINLYICFFITLNCIVREAS